MVRYTRPGAGVRASSCAAELRNSSPAAAPDLASSCSVPGAGVGAGAASPVQQRQPRVHAVHVGLAVRRLVPGVQAPAAPTLVMPETVLKNICGMRKILYLSKNTCSFSPQPYTAAVSEILNGS